MTWWTETAVLRNKMRDEYVQITQEIAMVTGGPEDNAICMYTVRTAFQLPGEYGGTSFLSLTTADKDRNGCQKC